MSNVICTRCVMDGTDPDIWFDEIGVCNHCHRYDQLVTERVFTGEDGRRRLKGLVEEIKVGAASRRYDCVIGMSGGVDSTYVALVVKRLGLRPLAVHLDNGWDSELAVDNINSALTRLGIDLHTHVIDWDEFRDLQVAFLRASTPDSEVPTDHAIVAALYHTAARQGVRYIITGHNFRTESHHPSAWTQGHWDWRYIKGVHRQFGSVPLRTFPHISLWSYWRRLRTHRWLEILNYLDYVKRDAMEALRKELGWRDYGSKHHESIYTRFYMGYLLPRKFGFDKRKCHFSSLICSGEMTRAEALEELKQEPYAREQQEADKAYVLKKLGLTRDEFARIMALPKMSYADYPSNATLYRSVLFNRLRVVLRLTGLNVRA
jgi:N-acetyl sugar amidotransferase